MVYKSLYDELLMRKERERMGSVGQERDVASFNIIDPPAAALEPVSPRRMLLLGGVLIMGLGAGGALAILLHQLHPVFHDARTLSEVTGRPVLGTISMTWLERYRLGRTIDFSSFAIAGMTLLTVFLLIVLLREQLSEFMGAILWQATA